MIWNVNFSPLFNSSCFCQLFCAHLLVVASSTSISHHFLSVRAAAAELQTRSSKSQKLANTQILRCCHRSNGCQTTSEISKKTNEMRFKFWWILLRLSLPAPSSFFSTFCTIPPCTTKDSISLYHRIFFFFHIFHPSSPPPLAIVIFHCRSTIFHSCFMYTNSMCFELVYVNIRWRGFCWAWEEREKQMKWKTCLKYETWNGSSPSTKSVDDDGTFPTEHFARVEIGWLLFSIRYENWISHVWNSKSAGRVGSDSPRSWLSRTASCARGYVICVEQESLFCANLEDVDVDCEKWGGWCE